MKKKLVTTMLMLMMAVGMTACGQNAEPTNDTTKEAVANSTVEGGKETEKEAEPIVDGANEQNAEEPVKEFSGKYYYAETDYGTDELDYTQYKITLVGTEGTITIKGYTGVGTIINGVGIAFTEDIRQGIIKQGIINQDGEELVPLGKYDSLTRVGKYEVRDYFVVRDAATQIYGVIDSRGEEIIPFQYEDIQIKGEDNCFYMCKKGDSYDIYEEDGELLIEGCSSNNFSMSYLYEDENGKWMYEVCTSAGNYYFWEGMDGYFSKPEDYASDWTYRGERIFSYVATDGANKMVSFSEDWQSMETLNVLVGTCTWLGDNLLVNRNFSGMILYDKDGNVLQSSGSLGLVRDYDGKVGYFIAGKSYFNEKPPTIYNDKFEEIIELPNYEKLQTAGGFLYAIPLEGTDGTHDLYDMDGNLVYKNVTIKSYDKEHVSFISEEGIFVHKTIDMPEVVCAETGEVYNGKDTYKDWYYFTNEAGQYICRDEKMNLIASFDERVTHLAGYEMFYGNGKFYNYQGVLIYEGRKRS